MALLPNFVSEVSAGAESTKKISYKDCKAINKTDDCAHRKIKAIYR